MNTDDEYVAAESYDDTIRHFFEPSKSSAVRI
jgi:hypothetical protein